MPKQFEGKKVMTPKFRCAFVKVFEPEAYDDGADKKYSITMLFPKGTDLSELKKVAKEAKKAKWGDKAPKKLRSPFRDGDGEDFEDYDGFENMIVVKATSKWKPGIVDLKLQNITDEADFYSGCWARATVQAFAYDTRSKGISFALQNLQKIEDDEQFGGGASAQDDFDDEVSEKEDSDFDGDDDDLGV